MLTTLLASRAVRTRNPSAQFLSVALHAALIAGAFAATRHAEVVLDRFVPEAVAFVRTAEPHLPPQANPVVRVAQLKGFRLLPPIFEIPSVLPQIDLTREFTNPGDFTGRGVPGGQSDGIEPTRLDAMTVEQVDRAASLLPGTGRPVYPEALRSAGLAGEVHAQFVIDSLGRADLGTLTIVSSTHVRFSEAVTRALAKARFVPAEFGGRRVRQVVRMPFVFSLEKR